MEKFTIHAGLAVPLDRGNVDTDAIVPKQFLKSIRRSGFGVNLFDAWRYLDIGEPDQDCSKRPLNPDFVLNQPRYHGASIMLARQNFGCGSSREHAPWALADYGLRVIIAPSFAEIFYNNCFKNGLLPIVLAEQEVDDLFNACGSTPGFRLAVDLPAQTVAWPGNQRVSPFEVDPSRKHRLLHGLDDIALTISHSAKIKAYEAWRKQEEDWVF
jgi:3-isopropylmalate/(R)-2-methylmalate dehydratase small subunit